MALPARLRALFGRLGRTPSFADEGWVRDWQKRRVLRLAPGAESRVPSDAASRGFEILPAGATLPEQAEDALGAPVEIERAVCVEDPRCCVYVREDGDVFPCSRLAATSEPLGNLPVDDPVALWEAPRTREIREAFVERGVVRDAAFFQIIGGSRSQYMRSLRLAAEQLPPPPPCCADCPLLSARP